MFWGTFLGRRVRNIAPEAGSGQNRGPEAPRAIPAEGSSPAAEWVLLTNNQRFVRQPAIQQALSSWPLPLNPEVSWTDQRSNLLQVLK